MKIKEKGYLFLRKTFFWIFFFSFVILTPVIMFYSLGYKFDKGSKKFQRTGTISIRTSPKEVQLYINGRKINELTPCTLREILPGRYTLVLEKEGFYSYTLPLEVKSSLVSEVDLTLIPRMRDIEKLKVHLNIYKFFVISHLFGQRMIAFTDKGIYFLDESFESAQKIVPLNIDEAVINTIEKVKEGRNKFVFWTRDNIWLVKLQKTLEKEENTLTLIYNTRELVKNASFALKDKYLIVHDGMKIIALDINNYAVSFPILDLKSISSDMFYDPDADILYVRDKLPDSEAFSLFKVNLMEHIHEKNTN